MTSLWALPLHSGLAGRDWLLQVLVLALIAGVWLLAAGLIERRAAARPERDTTPPPSADA